MPVRRTKCISTKVTEEELARIKPLASGQRFGEWIRAVLLNAATPPAEPVLLAEILALRVILLNLGYSTNHGERLTREAMQVLIDDADRDKHQHALNCLASPRPGRAS
jgi:hypothetical protein